MKNKINSVQVLGSGCPTCNKLFSLTQEAVKQLNLDVKVDHITDPKKLVELGVMTSPALSVNGELIFAGKLPSLNELKDILSVIKQEISCDSDCCCSCDGGC